ncbi:MAG: dihydrodipicolinate synthase family protein [Defluviitaleaceae bacterium]|nr:dihydrodipicolinate synthase family protein [Defluviitaleaceae bacterium]
MREETAKDLLRRGVLMPATPLALTKNRSLDEKRQRLLMRYYLSAGAGGIATGVHSTQFEIHDDKVGLYKPVLEIVSDEINRHELKTGKVIVKVAGVCGNAAQAAREASLARRLGYDAILLSPGGLSHLSESEMLERTREVAKIIPVIGFALQSAAGGRVFSYGYWAAFCEIESVAAIKTAPFDRYQTQDIVRAAATSGRSAEIALYTGNDDNIVVDLLTEYEFTHDGKKYRKHFDGGLLGHYSCWTKSAVEIYERCAAARASGTVDASLLTLAAKVTDMNAAIFDPSHAYAGCISGIHEVLRRQGLLEGIWCVSERERLSDGQADEISRVCAAYPELVDDAFISENISAWSMDL